MDARSERTNEIGWEGWTQDDLKEQMQGHARYKTILADPPWPYKTPGDGPLGSGPKDRPNSYLSENHGSGSVKRYGSMRVDDICALMPPAATDAHLYLWTTNAFMVEAHRVAVAWGFRQVTILTWTKTHQKDASRVSMKTGYYFRGATEHCLFCVRGSLRLNTTEALPTGYLWPRTTHSVKPDAFYDLVESASPAPYLEMFARRSRLGWDSWGDQVDSSLSLGGVR